MKTVRTTLSLAVLLAAIALQAAPTAQQSFDALKSLAGDWQGKASNGGPVEVTYHLTANGSALMSEIKSHEDMISMFHMDGSRLMMTHYCSAGNEPRMVAQASPDGKTFTFEFVDGTNIGPKDGHMVRAIFTIVDADHHTEQWVFATPDGKEMKEAFDLQRKK